MSPCLPCSSLIFQNNLSSQENVTLPCQLQLHSPRTIATHHVCCSFLTPSFASLPSLHILSFSFFRKRNTCPILPSLSFAARLGCTWNTVFSDLVIKVQHVSPTVPHDGIIINFLLNVTSILHVMFTVPLCFKI